MEQLTKKLEEAVESVDIEYVKQLETTLKEHSRQKYYDGEMIPRFEIKNNANAQKDFRNLGIELSNLTGGTNESHSLDIVNAIVDAKRRIEFLIDRPDKQTTSIVLLADSWGVHPLVDDLYDTLRDKKIRVLSKGGAGLTAKELIHNIDYCGALLEAQANILVVSAGGNDILGDGGIAELVLQFQPNVPISSLVRRNKVVEKIGRIIGLYKILSNNVLRMFGHKVSIFCHGYDYPYHLTEGKWLWPDLRDKGYTVEQGRQIIKIILDQFNHRLMDFSAQGANVKFIDCRNLVSVDQWFDTIHPNDNGAKVIGGVVSEMIKAEQKRITSIKKPDFEPETQNGKFEWGTVTREAIIPSKFSIGAPEEVLREDLAYIKANEDLWVRNYLIGSTEGLSFTGAVTALQRAALVVKFIKEAISLWEEIKRPDEQQRLSERARTFNGIQAFERNNGVLPLAEESVLSDVQEAIIGSSELELIDNLLIGYQRSKSVCRVQIMNSYGGVVGNGTGLLVGPGLLLTNHHVLTSSEVASNSFIILDDEISSDGRISNTQRFAITKELYVADENLDYVFVSVERVNANGEYLDRFGTIKLNPKSGKATKREPVSIIQHPLGGSKKVAIRNSSVIGVRNFNIYYTADTQAGSSASPVFNTNWDVVALHCAFVPNPMVEGEAIANRGVRISSIYKSLIEYAAIGEVGAESVLHLLRQDPIPLSLITNCVCTRQLDKEFIVSKGKGPLLTYGTQRQDFREKASNDSSLLNLIGDSGMRFIEECEISSKAHYEERLSKPIFPGGQSGVTIGIGYDLGQVSVAEFRNDWEEYLEEADLNSLASCVSLRADDAKQALEKLNSISIGYRAAQKIFRNATLPKYYRELVAIFGNKTIEILPRNCLAAILSLVYNRGSGGFNSDKKRYSEMRKISAALTSGRLYLVPELIRQMARLWESNPELVGLVKRREREADLFESGISEHVRPL